MLLRVLGVALTAFREALRSRILWVIYLFGLLALGAIALYPAVTPQEKAKFVVYWSLGAATFVGAMAMLFIVAPSASREIEDKSFQQSLVKPVGRWSFLAGRVLGYGAISTILFLGMGLLANLAVFSGMAGDLSGTAVGNPSRLVEASSVTVKGWSRPSKDWDVPRWLDPGGRIGYRFSGLDAGDARQPLLLISMPGTMGGENRGVTQAHLQIRNLTTQEDWLASVVLQREPSQLAVPAQMLRGPFLATLIASGGSIGLGSRRDPEDLGVRLLFQEEGSPALNILNAFLLKGLAVFLLCILAFLFSTFLSGKLALALGICVFLAGLNPGYTQVMGRILRGEIELEDPRSHSHDGEGSEEKKSPPGFGISILSYAADGLALVLPDLERFDAGDELNSGHNFGFRRVLGLMWYLGIYFLLSILVGGFVLRSRELG